MRKIIFTVYLFLASYCVLNAQITGVVTNEDKKPLEYVNVGLYQLPDSTLVTGVITDAKGQYSFTQAPSSQLFLKFSAVGYETFTISSTGSQTIILKPLDYMLKEFVITAREIETFGAKDKLLLPQRLKEKSSSALAALGEMPQFQLNRSSNILQTIDRQKILILIDGVQANENELMSLSPKQISNIEYYTQPPARFANKNVGAVVNVHTIKEKNYGFKGFLNTITSFTTGYGTNNANAKWYNPNNQLSLTYFIDYRNLNDNRINQTYEYEIDNSKIISELRGLPSLYKGEYHIFGVDYLNRQDDKHIFSAKTRYSLNPGRESHKQSTSITKGNQLPLEGLATKNLESRYDAVSLDLYYNKQLRKKQDLVINLVGTYFDSKSDNMISQSHTDKLLDYTYKNNIRNKSGSIISELLYSKSFSHSALNVGARYSYKSLDQIYNEDIHSTLNQQVFYLYSGYLGKVLDINYNIGLGIEHSVQGYQDDKSKHYTLFKPSLSASYKINSSSSLRLNSLVQSNAPSIAQLTTNPVYLYYQYYSVGNPNLHPFYSFYNRLQYQYSHSNFYLSAAVRHSYLNKPFMLLLKGRGAEIIKTWDHYKRVSYSAAELSFQWAPSKFIQIQPYGTILYTNAIRPDGNRLSDWTNYFSINTVLSYKDFSLLGNWTSSFTNLMGDITEKRMSSFFSELSYSKNNIYIGLQYIHNPNPSVNYSNNSLMNFREETIWNNFQNLFAVSFRYNFTIGRKKSINASTKLNNQDNVSGLSSDAIAK